MKKDRKHERGKPAGKTRETSEKAPAASGPDAPIRVEIRPRRRLATALAVIFAAWVVALVVMYFTMVYPRRHQGHSVRLLETMDLARVPV
jgi:hypothetical protein